MLQVTYVHIHTLRFFTPEVPKYPLGPKDTRDNESVQNLGIYGTYAIFILDVSPRMYILHSYVQKNLEVWFS